MTSTETARSTTTTPVRPLRWTVVEREPISTVTANANDMLATLYRLQRMKSLELDSPRSLSSPRRSYSEQEMATSSVPFTNLATKFYLTEAEHERKRDAIDTLLKLPVLVTSASLTAAPSPNSSDGSDCDESIRTNVCYSDSIAVLRPMTRPSRLRASPSRSPIRKLFKLCHSVAGSVMEETLCPVSPRNGDDTSKGI